ncbi:uncharacterized protein LOC106165186 [Lingula anatina]|uniref:Uncharacterized protein LOC106165186 n=1 Tax=Lingula anatina TaxID=7574 RepID=A0A1S3IKK9_LINAN|nr:uncharacterized protein LOC106165186 [Lingula anatina]|eukprot:XP_013398747.1 uncharacterized protein LOC106165186 [Lingula anatina]
MEIPYFMNRRFGDTSVAFFYKRLKSSGGSQGLINNGRVTKSGAPSVQIFSETWYIRGAVKTNVTTYEFMYRDSDNRMNEGDWHHVAYVCNSTNLLIFVNGTQRVNVPIEGQIARQPHSPMVIGVDRYIDLDLGFGSSRFKGYMDDIRFYDWAISHDEIEELNKQQAYRNGAPKS